MVNRGVELAAEVIDSPQAVIGQQVAAGVVVRMAVLYELLAGRARRPALDRARWRRAELLDHRPTAPADVLIRGAHVLDPREGIDEPLDVLVRDGEIAELGDRPDAPEGAEVIDGEGRHLFPGFVDPHVHLRTPGQEHKEDLDSGTRAAAAGGFVAVVAMPNTDPVVDSAPILRSLREQARREARIPVGFMASITRGLAGEALTEMAELRERRRARLHRRRQARPPRRDPAQGAAVPAARAAGPRACTRRTRRCRARASCTRARCPRGSASPASRASPSRR